ncbi:MAG: DUF1573 domain-containing protein [Bacteroidales bacterium]|nr:DUF1573 domain-containing protein [Bacteroidales bacterium]MBQ9712201.1 DUF1573 domain-containing protein [Bacteroidales bacterium]
MKDKIFVVTCSIICVVALGISIVNFSSIRRISSSSNSVTNQEETFPGGEESSEGDMIDVANMAPTIVEIVPKVVDLGEIPQDTVCTAQYILKNVGKEVLYLQSLKTGCFCTSSEYDRNFALPGENIVITLKFDSEGKPGNQTIYSVARMNTEEKDHKLTLKAKVRS